MESCPLILLWFPENYHLRWIFVCHLESRINHSGRLTILFLCFVPLVGVFQHLKQFPDYLVFWGGEKQGAVYFLFRQIKSDILKYYITSIIVTKYDWCIWINQIQIIVPEMHQTETTTILFFYNGIANIGDVKPYILLILILRTPRIFSRETI